MISVKSFIEGDIGKNAILLREFSTEFPYVYRNKYFANARVMSPEVSGRLKKSIGSQILGTNLKIVWRAPYARAVDAGGHTDKTYHFAPAKGYGYRGTGYMARPGDFHPYRTGSKGFVGRIGVKTFNDMIPYVEGKLGKK